MSAARRAAAGAVAIAAGVAGAVLAGRGSVRRHRTRPDPEAGEAFGTLPVEDLGPIRSFDGTDLAVRAAGPRDAPTIVFSHGFTLDMSTWHYQWRELSDRYRCVLFDQRGHGRSGNPPGGDFSLDAVGRDLRAVLDQTVGSGPVVLVGHSLGGMGILSFADRYPAEFGERVRGVVLADTAASDVLLGLLGTLGASLERRLRPLTDRVLFDPHRAERIQRAMDRWGRDLAFLIGRTTNFGPDASAAQVEYVTRISAGARVEVWTQMLRSLMELDLRRALETITVPALVIVGDRDAVTPKTSAVAMREALPDGRGYVITRAGHVAMLEQHRVFNDLLDGFLEEVLVPQQAATGCTVVLCPEGTVASGEVRGGAPGTRETDLLRPGMLVEHADAVLLTGGSAFGLAAADGVVRWLEEQGRGFDAGVARVPIVPAAVVFDLDAGDPGVRPGPEQGFAACEAASEEVPEGSVGAGTGATVGKLFGRERAVKGGLGTSSVSEEGVTVGVLAVVNAVGAVVDDDGVPLAGSLPEADETTPPFGNTTLAVVATDARLSRERAHLLAVAAHDGLARAIRPAHTMWDGDTVFTLATGAVDAPQPLLERIAEEALVDAVRRAVRLAESLAGIPTAAEEGGR